MILTRVFPDADDPLDLDAPDSRDRIAQLYLPPKQDWVRLNLIASVSGSATGSDGTSESLTNSADRSVLGIIRMLSDVVLVGAASVRAEGYFVPRKAALAVVTRSGNLAGHRITNTGQRGPLLILCPAGAVDAARDSVGDPNAHILAVPDVDGSLSAAAILAALRSQGYSSIVCEGGPELAAHLLRGGAIDEVCLTTSPILNGAGIPVFGNTEFETRRLTLAQLLVDSAGATYARWRLWEPV